MVEASAPPLRQEGFGLQAVNPFQIETFPIFEVDEARDPSSNMDPNYLAKLESLRVNNKISDCFFDGERITVDEKIAINKSIHHANRTHIELEKKVAMSNNVKDISFHINTKNNVIESTINSDKSPDFTAAPHTDYKIADYKSVYESGTSSPDGYSFTEYKSRYE